ncbi:MAG: tetratricopeptide repeat protein, partial [Candidatus Ratteibacteria bacterium]|nr:tetratricopeptide repeat protein [Candidatus Ratteibacteria bacterium]
MVRQETTEQCQGITLMGRRCTRIIPLGQKYCKQHKYFRRNNIPFYRNTLVLTWIGIIIAIIIPIYQCIYGPSRINQEKGLKNDETIIALLNELNQTVPQWNQSGGEIQDFVPSEKAVELAKKIKPEDGFYALGLKATAERRFDDARNYLEQAQKREEIELAYIYSARGNTEMYAGNYEKALQWCQKALALAPENRNIWQPASEILYYMGKYQDAEPLLLRAVEIDKESLGSNHPNVAKDLNN